MGHIKWGNMLKLIIFLLFLVVNVTACSMKTRTVKFQSNPSAAKIEVDGDYIGDTPVLYEVTAQADKATIKVIAYPEPPIYRSNKLFLQKRDVTVPLLREYESSIENAFNVYFDMGYRCADDCTETDPCQCQNNEAVKK